MTNPRSRRPRAQDRRYARHRSETNNFVGPLLLGVLSIGAVVGVGSIMVDEGPSAVMTRAADLLDNRARKPQPGDSWSGCNAPRELGTAPIYRGEPGYSENMDGDGDGIACEVY